jgi:hypothetical protein
LVAPRTLIDTLRSSHSTLVTSPAALAPVGAVARVSVNCDASTTKRCALGMRRSM